MRKSLSGFTLLEICIAIAIFAIGALTAMSILVPAVRWGADAKNDFTAAEAALSVVEYLNTGGQFLTSDGAATTTDVFCGRTNNNTDTDANIYPYIITINEGTNILKPPVSSAKNNILISVYRKKYDPFADPPAYKVINSSTDINTANVIDNDPDSSTTIEPLFQMTTGITH